MKIDYSEEWFKDSSEIEGECEIGAGFFEPFDDNNLQHVEGSLIDNWDYYDGECECFECLQAIAWTEKKWRQDHL